MMPQVWSAVKSMHANTLEVPIYWEQIEPQPGKYDFSLVDTLLQQGRKHNVRLVLLWFATWKNGSNHYMPEWMKRDAAKYPNITGKNGPGEGEAETAVRLAPLAQEYAMVGPMMREMAKWAFEGKIKAVVEREDHAEQTIDLGAWQAVVQFSAAGGRTVQSNASPEARALLNFVHAWNCQRVLNQQ